jgi:hypothetical protein
MQKWIAIAAFVACTTACGGGRSKPAALTVVEACKPEHDKQVVTVEAFTNVPIMAFPCAKVCSVDVSDAPDYSNHTMEMDIPVGTGPLTMEGLANDGSTMVPASHYTIVDSDGKRRAVGAKVRITGKVEARIPGVHVCIMTPTEIHAATAE